MQGPGLNWRFILKVLGFTLSSESLFLFLSATVSFYYEDWDALAFLISGIISLLCGIALILSGTKEKVKTVGKRESFLTVSLVWLFFSIFGAFPYYISGAIPNWTDAFFESVSGLTTTGATILTNIDDIPRGLLFWRSLSQWLGGMGVIVFSLALLPLIGDGAAQLFDAETTGITHDKFRPRVTAVAKRLWGIYTGLTILLFFLLYAGPMDFFDSLCHAFTTISTGGYSTKQASIAHWNSTYTDCVIIIFMLIGGINFSLFYFLFKRNFKKVTQNEELKWYLLIVLIATIIITLALVKDNIFDGHFESLRTALFQVASIITTTGFATGDFVQWGPFYWIIFLLLMTICGCAGSTSGGLKTIRLVVLCKNTWNEFGKLIHPKAVIPVRMNGSVLSFDVVQRTMAFTALYVILILLSSLLFSMTGMKFEEAFGAAITAISNTGPGLGSNGPSGSFANISPFAKWYMSFLMLIGRLEIFTVLILFTPGFWKR